MELLRAEGLKKHFIKQKMLAGGSRVLRAVDGVDFNLDKDRVLALVGESGCGKSTVARLLLRLMEPTDGRVLFKGQDLFEMGREDLRRFRRSVQIVFQDPFASLNPRRTVYDTISEPLIIHKIVKRQGLKDSVADILRSVGLGPDVMSRYPHEFSGGQRQRICIARALAVSPEVIVADEPLSALDVSIQAQIINLLLELKKQTGISFVFISHDLRVVHYLSDVVCVMYLGRIVEHAKADELFERPLHPYSELLLASAPQIRTDGLRTSGGSRTAPANGEAPSPFNLPTGCAFHPRCPKRFAPCDKSVPELKDVGGRLVSCHLWDN